MKIFTAEQIREWDQHTVLLYYNNSSELMERAANAVVEHLSYSEINKAVTIFCGTGNNGGDGLCIARMLAERDYVVDVYIVGDSQKGTEDFKLNMQRLLESEVPVQFLSPEELAFEIKPRNLVLDCILGTGITRPVEGFLAQVIDQINEQSPFRLIAIDMPSGLMPDDMTHQEGSIIRADKTITFEVPKRAMLCEENEMYVGEFTVLSLGLSDVFHEETSSNLRYYDMLEATLDFEPRNKFVHKTQLGHVHVVAGSVGKMGAAMLCAKAALRSGAGLVSASVPACGTHIMQTTLPEAMCILDEGNDYLKSTTYDEKFGATVVGPGLGKAPETVLMLRKLLRDAKHPLVLDADALNIIAEKKLIKDIPKNSILTPHVGEFHRLFGEHTSDHERLKTLETKAKELELYIVLKGPNTRIATPQGIVHFNASGNACLATAGSGDVLAGVIAGLLGQGYTPEEAARLGVFVHGFAGDMLRAQLGEGGMIARDLIEALPQAMRTIFAAQSDPNFY
jgi:NAD(P)H-hydrate epimerase